MIAIDHKKINKSIGHLTKKLSEYEPRNRYCWGGCLTFATGLRDAINKYYKANDAAQFHGVVDDDDDTLRHVFVYCQSSGFYFDAHGGVKFLYQEHGEYDEVLGPDDLLPEGWKQVLYINYTEAKALTKYFLKSFQSSPEEAQYELAMLECFVRFIPTESVTDEDEWYSWSKAKREKLMDKVKTNIEKVKKKCITS